MNTASMGGHAWIGLEKKKIVGPGFMGSACCRYMSVLYPEGNR